MKQNKNEKVHQTPYNWKWTLPNDKYGRVHLANVGQYSCLTPHFEKCSRSSRLNCVHQPFTVVAVGTKFASSASWSSQHKTGKIAPFTLSWNSKKQ